MAAVEVRLLGPVEVHVGVEVVRPPAAKVRELLAMLALDANRPLDADVLGDRLWRGVPPRSSASVLRTYVSQIRRLFPDGHERLERVGDGYRLRLETHELDVTRFDAAIDAAARAGPSRAVSDGLRQALSLWRGTPLPELADDDRARAEVARLEARRSEAVESLAEAELALGRHESVVAELEAAVQEAPFREQLVAQLMVALYRSGRQAEALVAFQRLRRSLLDELGLDPGPELVGLESAILRQDPSLDAPPRRAGSLPATSTPCLGRELELQRLTDAVGEARLVTLTGVGGCGKTRLALELARRLEEEVDEAWFVELAARRAPDEVGPAVLATLGVPQRVEEEPIVTLQRTFAGRRPLLVLDNCEHVAGACAVLAAALLDETGAIVVATSRVALGVPGELVWPVPPLPSPEPGSPVSQITSAAGAQLLADRMAAARGGRSPSDDEWPGIGELCRRLDGLPLALELLAPKAAVLPMDELLAALDHQLLGGASRAAGGPGHHRDLAACVQWSLDLLEAEDRRLLQRVCLLGPSVSTRAAAVFCGSASAALAGLDRLTRQSLLQPDPDQPGRFRVLETVRQVVRRTLPDDAADEALDALASWLADWAEELEPAVRGPAAAQALEDLESELGPLRAALSHALGRDDPRDGVRIAIATSWLWAIHGRLVEGHEWLARALEVADEVEPTLRMRLLVASGSHLALCGDVDGFARQVDAALSLARVSLDHPGVLKVLLWAGRSVQVQGRHGEAGALYAEALQLAESSADAGGSASALAGLGDAAASGGDLDGAALLHLRSLAAFRSIGDPHGIGQALLNVADVDRLAGRFGEASERLDEAAHAFTSIADRSCVAAALELRARTAADAGRPGDAEELYRRAIDIRRDLLQDRHVASTLVELAGVLTDGGRLTEAAAALGAAGEDAHPVALRLRAELGDRRYLAAWADGSAARITRPR